MEKVLMQNLATGMHLKKRGFTLVEILVVIIIIGITISFALLSFGDFGASRQAKISAEHFVSYLRLLQHKAIFEDRTLALAIYPHGYSPLVFQEDEKWLSLNSSNILRNQQVPSRIIISAGSTGKNLKHEAMLVIHPSGDMEPFEVYFGTNRSHSLVKVTGSHDGKISIHE